MFAPAEMIAPVALKPSAATVGRRPGSCDLLVPYTGTITSQTRSAMTSSLRQRMIQMRYGTRLKGVAVQAQDGVLTVTATASNFAIEQWLSSGEFVDAVEAAVRQARVTVTL